MSIQATSYVLHRRYGSQTRKLLMIAIADFANDDGEAWPSVDTLAQRAECSRRAVQENIRALQIEGELALHPNAGPRGCNLYRVIFKNSTDRKTSSKGGAPDAPPVQMDAAQTHGGGADERRPDAPEPLGTIMEPSGERERPRARADQFAEIFRDTLARINSLRPEWAAAPGYSKRERLAFMDNAEALQAVAPERWETVRRYLAAKLPQGSAGFQPVSREQFLAASNDVLAHALQWERKQAKPAAAARPSSPVQTPEEKAQAERELAEWLAAQKTVR